MTIAAVYLYIYYIYYKLRWRGFPDTTSLISSTSSVSYFSNASANRLCSVEWTFNKLYALSCDSCNY